MTKITQKQAVFMAISNVLAEAGINFEGQAVQTLMSKDHRGQVNQILFEGFQAGTIELDREYSESDLKAYVSGLQSNWIRKDKRLNGGTQYVAKNPGSRAGSSDPMLKNLRALKSTLTDEGDIAEVEAAIKTRVSELSATKVKATVDFSALPADLAAKFAK